VERVVANGAFFRTRIVWLVVISHYYGIDLPFISQSFTTGWSDEEINAFEEEVTPIAQSLAYLLSSEDVLQALEEGEK
jgi:hypothetical protein